MNQEELKMRRGINLGNSLDCFAENGPGNETSWGNPPVTRETVKMFAGAGFDTLRVPVTWDGHFEETDPYTVDPAWMARVREVVEWGMESGMTVILNTHHEFRWLRPELGELWHVLPRFRALWLQIAEAFGDCGDRLIFQGVNEPNLQGGENCSEGSGNRNVRAAINAVNHTFVSAVRETGGRNAVRPLCVTGLAARPLPECMQEMIFPRDEHLIYTLHCYSPDRFVFSRGDSADTPFFDEQAEREVRALFEDIARYGAVHGVPLMITEFGAVAKRMPDGRWNTEERIRFLRVFLECADRMNIPCVWWDNNYLETGDEAFGLFNRSDNTCRFPEAVRTLTGVSPETGKER